MFPVSTPPCSGSGTVVDLVDIWEELPGKIAMRFTWILGIGVCAAVSAAQTLPVGDVTHVGRYDLDTGEVEFFS